MTNQDLKNVSVGSEVLARTDAEVAKPDAEVEAGGSAVEGAAKQEAPVVKSGRRETRGSVADVLKGKSLVDVLRGKFGEVADVTPVHFDFPELKGKEVFRIDVRDMKRWASRRNMRKLVPAFGETVFEAYKDREDPAVYNPSDRAFMENFFENDMDGTDLSASNRIVAIADGGKVIGFVSYSDFPVADLPGVNVGFENLGTMHPNYKGGGVFRKFREAVLDGCGYDALASVSHTPAAVKSLIPKGKNAETDVMYFAGARNGDDGIQLSDKESAFVKIMNDAVKKASKDDEVIGHLQEGVPDGYVSYGTFGIPPRKKTEVDVARVGQPLADKLFQLIDWQERNRPADDCVYGIVVCAKKSVVEGA
ncbi:MAG: hypothetical protein WC651_05510 [Candidatus Gracilibacteria bacterium]|jgi:hypothetical protein